MNERRILLSGIKNMLDLLVTIDKEALSEDNLKALMVCVKIGIVSLYESKMDDDDFEELYTLEDFSVIIQHANEHGSEQGNMH